MNIDVNKRDWVNTERPKQVRKIGTTRRSVSGFFMFRGEKSIPYESTLERDFLVRLSQSRFVSDIIAQPIQLKYLCNNGNYYPYTPDYLVYYHIGKDETWENATPPLLVEVKPRNELRDKWADMKPKFRTALQYAKEQGWRFKIYDEFRIRDQKWENIMFLVRYKRMGFPIEDSQWIIDNLKCMGQATLDYLVTRHFFGKHERAVGISHVWHLLYTGKIECDLSLPLNNSTVLWVPTYE